MDYPKSDTKVQSGPDISGLLQPGEQVLWQGQPSTLNDVEGSRTLLSRIAIVILLLMIVSVTAFDVAVNGLVTSLPVTVFAFAATVATLTALINTPEKASNAYYWLTNQRAIIIRGPLPMSGEFRTTIIKLAQIDAVRLVSAPNGSGSISFGRHEVVPASQYAPTNDPDYTFSNIPDVAHVYQLVQQAQLSAGKQD